ncbi:subtilisin-like protein [Colletotrichum eremochloae]|nr:subtilisin-like protein [Colletotrichum eremochloae]
MLLETLVYWLLLSLALAQENQPPANPVQTTLTTQSTARAVANQTETLSPSPQFTDDASPSPTAAATATPTSPPRQDKYIVWIKTDIAADPNKRADFEEYLTPFAQPGTLKNLAQEYASNDDIGIYVLFTTEDHAQAISQDSRVVAVDLDVPVVNDEPSSPIPAHQDSFQEETFGNTVVQSDSQYALNDLSLPQSEKAKGFTCKNVPGYAFAKEAGEGVTVYVLDTGANPHHTEYINAKGTKRWLFANEDKDEDDKGDHGSCLQSLVNGPNFGAAKAADIVIVKVGEDRDRSLENIIFGLVLIYQDVVKNKLQGKAVVTMALGTKAFSPGIPFLGIQPDFLLKDEAPAYKSALQFLIEEDVVVVAASGNGRQSHLGGDTITDYPALLGQDMDVITVGAVDVTGKRTDYSQGLPPELDTSAVGTTICASNNGNADVEKSGTSMSTALVSGMIAVLLSQDKYRERLQIPGKVAANVKQLVRELSYYRSGGDTSVAWNGEDVFTCQSGPGKLRARGVVCAINAIPTETPAATKPAVTPTTTSAKPPATTSTTTSTTSLTTTTSSAAPVVPTPLPPVPVPCYNFNLNTYGYCCPDANNINKNCKNNMGTCWLPFQGEGVGGGGDGLRKVPTGARCPPPPGAKDNW